MFTLLMWIVFGWISGAIAEAVWPPAEPTTRWQTIAIGVAGSVAGGIVGSLFTGSNYKPAGVVMSVVGAIICMFALRKFKEIQK